MANGPTVQYNGLTLNTDWWVTGVSRPKPEFSARSENLEGADGTFFRGMALKAANVSVSLAPKAGKDLQGLYDALMAKLDVDAPKRLQFGDEGGRYRMAVPAGLPSMHEWHDYSTITVEFMCPHPALYGETKTASLSTSASSVVVAGTYPATCKVTSSNATKSSSDLWGVRFDNRDFMRVPLASSSASSVAIDSDSRTARAAGSTTMITLDSDWVELSPGSHTVKIDQGGGTATLEWTERWL